MIKNEKGSTFMLVVIGLFIVVIFTTVLISMRGNSERNVAKESSTTQAYYVAKTGAESLISHISKQADIKVELNDLIAKTAAGDYGTGDFEGGKFEIRVTETVNADGTSTYRIISKGTVKETDKSVTAVLNPNYASSGWGDGQVYASGELTLGYIPQMEGAGLKLYTLLTKDKTKTSPIKFEQGGAMDLFLPEDGRWGRIKDTTGKTEAQFKAEGLTLNDQVAKILNEKGQYIGDYSLVVKDGKGNEVIKEVLENKAGGHSLEFNYGVDPDSDPRFKEPIFPSYTFGSSSMPSGATITSSGNYSEAKFNSSSSIDGSGAVGDILIATKLFEVGSNQTLTIKTKKNRNINIVVDEMKVLEGAKIDVIGDGEVNFYVNTSAQFDGGSRTGIKEGITEEPLVNCHLKAGGNLQTQNGAELYNFNILGPGGRVNFQDNTVCEGVIFANIFSLKDKCTIKSPTTGTASIDTDNIIDFKKIIWEK